jgi:hypothetical protein
MPELEESAEKATVRPELALAETRYVTTPTTAFAGGVEVKAIVCRLRAGDGDGAGGVGVAGGTTGFGTCGGRGAGGVRSGGNGKSTSGACGCVGVTGAGCDGADGPAAGAPRARGSSCVTSAPVADAPRKRNRSCDSNCCVGVSPSARREARNDTEDGRPLVSSMPSSALCNEIATLVFARSPIPGSNCRPGSASPIHNAHATAATHTCALDFNAALSRPERTGRSSRRVVCSIVCSCRTKMPVSQSTCFG